MAGGHQMPLNMPPCRHAIHGIGWQSAWSLRAVSTTCDLELSHKSDPRWPFDFNAKWNID